jgi:glucose/arabinose dehydrogenase
MFKRTTTLTALLIINFSFLISVSNAQPNLTAQVFTVVGSDPTAIAHAGDDRLFVVEQIGRIRIVQSNGTLVTRPFLNIQSIVTSGGEQGLLGLAFSPNYATDRSFFVYYTDLNGIGNTAVARYKVSATDPDSADAASGQVLLNQTQPYSNHNGGCIQFGKDGYLYIALGDGGSGGDPQNYGQNRTSLLGKILRIDVSNTTSTTYAIPPTNPFFGMASTRNEIWAIGMRNPWRFSFDRYTREMWIGDVGQGAWEEIDREAPLDGGHNYGWRCREGAHNYNFTGCTTGYTDPVFEYGQAATGGCSVTGGYVYRGANYAGLSGYYYYADYCLPQISALNYNTYANYNTATATNTVTTFGEDVYGELYFARGNGIVYKIVDNTNCNPNAIVFNTTGDFYCGDSVKLETPFFPGFTYQWSLNGNPVTNATNNTYYATASGTYAVYVEKTIACFSNSANYVLGQCLNVGVSNTENKISVAIVPNPSNGNFKVNISGLNGDANSYTITDLSGKVILKGEVNNCQNKNCQLDLQLAANGFYFLKLFDGAKEVAKEKLVVM